MKTYSKFKEGRTSRDKLDKYVSDEIKKRKLAKFPVNATDDYKMKKADEFLEEERAKTTRNFNKTT